MADRRKPRQPRLTAAEIERIAWLTEHNLERLGKQYHKAAEQMAVCQVALERSGSRWFRHAT